MMVLNSLRTMGSWSQEEEKLECMLWVFCRVLLTSLVGDTHEVRRHKYGGDCG
jgi:hypothetical protein